MGLHTKSCGTPLLSRAKYVTTAGPVTKFPADTFDQYLTNPIDDGILIIEV
jgi:hypothetical protein